MRTSELLTEIRRAMGAPTYQARFSNDDVLATASSQQTNFVVPQIRSLRRNFMLTNEDFSILSGEDTLPIPARAVGRGIKDIWLSEVTTSPALSDFRKLREVDVTDLLGMNTSTGETFAFYFEDDEIKLFPELSNDVIIRLYYLTRPGNLVQSTRTCTITAVGTDTLTVDAVPSNIINGSVIDVVKVNPGYKTLLKDLTLTARAFNSVTVSGYDFSATDVAVGDIVSLARETSVIQLPEDAHELLIWSTANEMAVSLGIADMIQATEKQVLSALNGMRQAMAPRTDEARVIVNNTAVLRSGSKFAFLAR